MVLLKCDGLFLEVGQVAFVKSLGAEQLRMLRVSLDVRDNGARSVQSVVQRDRYDVLDRNL